MQNNNTRRKLVHALLKLMETNSYKTITVKEITFKAGLSRRTFYTYFESTYAVLQECFRIKTRELSEKIFAIENLSVESFLNCYIGYFYENRKILKIVLNDEAISPKLFFDRFFSSVEELLKDLIPERYNLYNRTLHSFVSGGAQRIITEWVNSDCRTSTREISETIGIFLSAAYKTEEPLQASS